MGFEHVILTRFNLATPGRESTIRNQPGWLRQRFDLFAEWCHPSVAAQTERDFRWIVLFDVDTPQAFRDEIEALQAAFWFDTYFTPLFPADGWRQTVAQVAAPTAPMLLTSRLDNDDALAVDYVARVQAAVQGSERRAFNCTNGLIRQGDGLWQVAHPKNAFFSLLEPWGPQVTTACGIQHMQLPNHAPVTQIGGAPAWLQVVHGGNVSNKVRGRRVGPEVGTRFGGKGLSGVRAPRWPERAVDHLMAPMRGLRDKLAALR